MTKIGVLGLGYVGLPLACAFAEKYSVVGFDLNQKRVAEIKDGWDRNNEISKNELKNSKLVSTTNISDMKGLDVIIITVPTPIDNDNKPDLTALVKASELVGSIIKQGSIVIFESTVFPGATEEICVPIIERTSNLTFNEEFFCGYSPERINPGDKKNTFKNILKVVSGSDAYSTSIIDELYQSVIPAGTYIAQSIKVAEAAKVIENTQRDINIALMNELSIICKKLNIDTQEVLAAARTKWNFLPFEPGLVGGHCIGVDPYYLAYKAKKVGVEPKIILSARSTNDAMHLFAINEILNIMSERGLSASESKVLILGVGFKENCPDIRNSKVLDLYRGLTNSGVTCELHDPVSNPDEVEEMFKTRLIQSPSKHSYDAVIIAVKHDEYYKYGIETFRSYLNSNGIIADLKSILPSHQSDFRL